MTRSKGDVCALSERVEREARVRKRSNLRRCAVALSIVALASLTACGDDDDTAEDEASSEGGETGPIRIGLVASLTGPESFFSAPNADGFEMAVAELEEEGGIDGREVELIVEDSESRTQGAIDGAAKLIDVDNVDLLVSSVSDFLAVAEFAQDQDVFLVNGGASNPLIRDVPGVAVSMVSLDDVVAQNLAQWAYDEGYQSAAVLVGDDPYGLGVQEYVSQGFEDLGGEVVDSQAVPYGQPDYRPEMQRIADADPDVIFSATFADDAKLQFRQLGELGEDAPWYELYPTVLGLDDYEPAFERLFGLDIGWEDEEAADWNARYAEMFGDEATVPWPALGYDTLQLAALAVANAEGDTAEDQRDAFLAAADSYVGPSGPLEFDDDFTRVDQIYDRLMLTSEGFVPAE
jgi:branched-chain amino acid transport system substrate-binding protein